MGAFTAALAVGFLLYALAQIPSVHRFLTGVDRRHPDTH